jgi:hypothetical protein
LASVPSRATGSVSGRVVDTKGHPLAGALVVIESGPSHPDIAAESGADGGFGLAGLHAGRCLLRGEAEGFSRGFAEVTIIPGKRVSVTIQLLTLTTDSGWESAEDEWFESSSDEVGGNDDDASDFER